MKCNKCNKNEATVFYREIINGKETKYSLCADCAKEKELSSKSIFDMPDFFGGSLLGSYFKPSNLKPKQEEKKCSLCASTFHTLCKNGKVGCPVCYSVFKEELAPTIRRLHGTAEHRGTVPQKARQEIKKENDIKALEEKLRNAIALEKYEDAATLRDQIRALRNN